MIAQRLLVIAAHPDDEVLGCGGLLARTIREGGQASVLILTEGCSTQYPDQPHFIDQKKLEAKNAMKALGGVDLQFADLPEMRLSSLPPAEVNDPVLEAVKRVRPDCVLVHHSGDLNRDHGVVHEAARVACRPSDFAPDALLAYETLSSTEWGQAPFGPHFFVQLQQSDIEAKMAALRCYESEIRTAPHPRSVETILQLAQLRGSQAGFLLAESYQYVYDRRK